MKVLECVITTMTYSKQRVRSSPRLRPVRPWLLGPMPALGEVFRLMIPRPMSLIFCLERQAIQGTSPSDIALSMASLIMIYTLLCVYERPDDHGTSKRRTTRRRRFERGSPKLFIPKLPRLQWRNLSQGRDHDSGFISDLISVYLATRHYSTSWLY